MFSKTSDNKITEKFKNILLQEINYQCTRNSGNSFTFTPLGWTNFYVTEYYDKKGLFKKWVLSKTASSFSFADIYQDNDFNNLTIEFLRKVLSLLPEGITFNERESVIRDDREKYLNNRAYHSCTRSVAIQFDIVVSSIYSSIIASNAQKDIVIHDTKVTDSLLKEAYEFKNRIELSHAEVLTTIFTSIMEDKNHLFSVNTTSIGLTNETCIPFSNLGMHNISELYKKYGLAMALCEKISEFYANQGKNLKMQLRIHSNSFDDYVSASIFRVKETPVLKEW